MCDMASAQNGELAEVKTETGRMSDAVGVRDKKEQHMQGDSSRRERWPKRE